MDVTYTFDTEIIVNTLVYIWRTLLLGINAFETIGLQIVQCALEQSFHTLLSELPPL